jgi:hypothetical protein
MRIYTTKFFIEKANIIHNNFFSYDKTSYINSKSKIEIICPNHESFWQTPENHLQGQGCPICGKEKLKKKLSSNTIEFINNAVKQHGNKFEYDDVIYINGHTKIWITCPTHGKFLQMPYSHLAGKGCPYCRAENNRLMSENKRLNSKNTFIDKVTKLSFYKNIKYNYSKTKYINSSSKVEIICPSHGSFWQKPNDHLNGRGCEKCGNESIYSTDDFISKAQQCKFHKLKNYNYSTVKYVNSYTKVSICCPKHGNFMQSPHTHLLGGGCPKCKQSKGESLIELFLKENKIQYENQKRFPSCKNIHTLPFDFAIYLNENLRGLIEFQGKQHYKIWGSSKKEKHLKQFQENKLRDKIKKEYCSQNNIPLLEIPYTKINNIDSILKSWLNIAIAEHTQDDKLGKS